MTKTALVLTGGGARGAYQAGFLRGLSEIVPKGASPFPILTGTSVGAINAAYLMCCADDFQDATRQLWHMWETIKPEGVFIPKRGAFSKVLFNLIGRALLGRRTPLRTTLLNNKPLQDLLAQELDFGAFRESLSKKTMHAVSFTTMDYNRGISTTFFEGSNEISDWETDSSLGRKAQLSVEHVAASAALPLLFEPVRIEDSFFGDGSLRLMSPLRPAVRLGADRLMVIATHRHESRKPILITSPEQQPSFGSVMGSMLRSVFSDALDTDLARLKTINGFIEAGNVKNGFRQIPALKLHPSQDLGEMAIDCCPNFPPSFMRLIDLLGGAGGMDEGFLSYLSFESKYTIELLKLGHKDAINQKSKLRSFLGID